MVEPEYRVISEGKVKPGNDLSIVRQHVAGLFKSDEAKIDRLFAGREVVVKSRITFDVADKYSNALNKAGLACRVEPEKKARGNGADSRVPTADDAGARSSSGKIQEEELPQCPACGYRAKNKNDDLIVKYDGMGECPVCGIIVTKYRAARARVEEKSGSADSHPGSVTPEENGKEQDPSVSSMRNQADAPLNHVRDNLSGSAASADEKDENEPLSGWPLYYRGCIILSLIATILFGWKVGGGVAVVTIPSYWAYFIWKRDRTAVIICAVLTCGGIFLLMGVAYLVRTICSLLQETIGVVRIKRHFLSASLVLLLIVSIMSLFGLNHIDVLPQHNHAESKNVKESVAAQIPSLPQHANKESESGKEKLQPIPPEARAASKLFESARALIIRDYEKTGVLSTDIKDLANRYGDMLNLIQRSKLLAAILSKKLHVEGEGRRFTVIVIEDLTQTKTKRVERYHYFGTSLDLPYPVYTQKTLVFDLSKAFDSIKPEKL